MAEGGREGRDGGEILTVQAGNYANQIGAHYWNNQVTPLPPSDRSTLLSTRHELCDRQALPPITTHI